MCNDITYADFFNKIFLESDNHNYVNCSWLNLEPIFALIANFGS